MHSLGPLVPLTQDDGKPLKRSLYDFVDREDQNSYERAVALVLDRHADLLWWFRNRVGPENFAIQGYRRQRIYPDFVAQTVSKGRRYHRVLVIESKGAHLEGNPDTTYKRAIAKFFDRAGKRVTWHQLGKPFKDHVFTFEILDEAQEYGRTWRDEIEELLAQDD
jgi:type III restriction enzyme